MNILELAFKRHQNWIDIVCSFGCNKDTAEDIVMEMYIRLDKLVASGVNFTYKDDINYFFVFKILYTMFLDLKRKESKTNVINIDDITLNDKTEEIDLTDYELHYKNYENALLELHWYDKQVFEMISDGLHIAKLSKRTNISYHSLRNTYRRVKKFLKGKI